MLVPIIFVGALLLVLYFLFSPKRPPAPAQLAPSRADVSLKRKSVAAPAAPRRSAVGALFDPAKSQISESARSAFIYASNMGEPLSSSLKIGLGSHAVDKLKEHNIVLVCQLVGRFLSLRAAGMSSQSWADACYVELSRLGITSHRSGIVRAVCEKIQHLLPGSWNTLELDNSGADAGED
jgi:hypothetical protein